MATGAERWRFPTLDTSHRAISDGRTVVVSASDTIYAVSAATDGERWHLLPEEPTSYRTILVASGVVYVGGRTDFPLGYLFALDASTGTERWRIEDGYTVAPVGGGGTVYVAVKNYRESGSPNNYVYALGAPL